MCVLDTGWWFLGRNVFRASMLDAGLRCCWSDTFFVISILGVGLWDSWGETISVQAYLMQEFETLGAKQTFHPELTRCWTATLTGRNQSNVQHTQIKCRTARLKGPHEWTCVSNTNEMPDSNCHWARKWYMQCQYYADFDECSAAGYGWMRRNGVACDMHIGWKDHRGSIHAAGQMWDSTWLHHTFRDSVTRQ